ncbi:MAG: HlyD family type I secretion periplasmic adaptor subunit [Gallionella sp.]|jgi:HlyD family type I secretion membrane fusion protein
MKLKQWLHFFKSDKQDAEVDAILNDKASPLPTDDKARASWGLRMLWLLLGIALIWAIVAPLSQGVSAHGFIKVEGNRKTLQHLKGGIIEEILVKEGDRVGKNQPLLVLNQTQLKAQQGMVESQLVVWMAIETRLMAERDDRDVLIFPEFMQKRMDQPQVSQAVEVHTQLFRTRRNAIKGEQSIGKEAIAGMEEQIHGLSAQEQSKAKQLISYKEELATLRPLYEEGFIPRNRLFELERAVAYLAGQRSDDLASIGRARSQIAETRLKMLQSISDYKKEVETQLSEAQSKVADLKERLVATQDDLDRVVVRAPAAGVVVDLAVHTLGGVVAPGQKLMDLVPEGGGIVVEVQIPTHLIDNVHAGMDADVHFTALDQIIVPTIPGKLVYVSADRITDPRTDISYFVGRVMISEPGMKLLGNNNLQPGMPADVVLKMSQHSLVGYMLKPLLNRLRFAFSER